MPRGTLIFVFVHNIAEMNVSEPDKKHLQFSKKSDQPKLNIFACGFSENLENPGNSQIFLRQIPAVEIISAILQILIEKSMIFRKIYKIPPEELMPGPPSTTTLWKD